MPAETIWIHAASVGEVRAAAPLVGELLRQRPAARILVSTFTASGRRVAAQTLADGRTARALPAAADRLGVDPGAGDPPGAPGAVHSSRDRTLAGAADGPAARPGAGADRQRPDLAAQLRTLPAAAPRVAPRARGDHAGAGAHRRRRRAVPRRSACPPPGSASRGISSTPAGTAATRRASAVRRRSASACAPAAGRTVLVAGSVRGPESDLVLEAFRRLRGDRAGPAARACPAPPRALRRRESSSAWPGAWVRWSAAPRAIDPGTAVVVLDTLGELADFYAAADVACVGGTWGDHGGHNLLEPAYHGVPVVFGPDIAPCRGRGPGAAGRRRRFSGRRCRRDLRALSGAARRPRCARRRRQPRPRGRRRRSRGRSKRLPRAAQDILDGRRRAP